MKPAKPVRAGNPVWTTIALPVPGAPGIKRDCRALRIGDSCVAAVQAGVNRWKVIHIETGREVRWTMGTRADMRLALVASERDMLELKTRAEGVRTSSPAKPLFEMGQRVRIDKLQRTGKISAVHGFGSFVGANTYEVTLDDTGQEVQWTEENLSAVEDGRTP